MVRTVCEWFASVIWSFLALVTRRPEPQSPWECFGSCLGAFMGADWEGDGLPARLMIGLSASLSSQSTSGSGLAPTWRAGCEWGRRSIERVRMCRGRPRWSILDGSEQQALSPAGGCLEASQLTSDLQRTGIDRTSRTSNRDSTLFVIRSGTDTS